MTSGPSCLVDPRSWDQLLLDSEASLRLVDTALRTLCWRWGVMEPVNEHPVLSSAAERSRSGLISAVANDVESGCGTGSARVLATAGTALS